MITQIELKRICCRVISQEPWSRPSVSYHFRTVRGSKWQYDNTFHASISGITYLLKYQVRVGPNAKKRSGEQPPQ